MLKYGTVCINQHLENHATFPCKCQLMSKFQIVALPHYCLVSYARCNKQTCLIIIYDRQRRRLNEFAKVRKWVLLEVRHGESLRARRQAGRLWMSKYIKVFKVCPKKSLFYPVTHSRVGKKSDSHQNCKDQETSKCNSFPNSTDMDLILAKLPTSGRRFDTSVHSQCLTCAA